MKKKRLSKTTLMAFRSIARKGSDKDLEELLFKTCRKYAEIVLDGEKYVNPDDYIEVRQTEYTCTCPECGCEMDLDLKEFAR